MKEFKDLVNKTLKQQNKSQRNFAQELNIRPTKLNDILCERIPFPRQLFEEICKKLEIDETQINFNPVTKYKKYQRKVKVPKKVIQTNEIELLKQEIEELKITVKTLAKMIERI